MKKLLLPYLFLLPCFTPLLAQNSQQLAPMPFIMDMVHNNPGEAPYVTKYTDGQFLASHGYNSCVPHWHINCAVTYDSYRKNMVARHSDERRWIEQRAATISRKLDSLKQAGLQVYPFTDFVVFPQSVWKAYGKEIGGEGQVAGGTSTDGRTRSVNIRSERTQQLLRAQIAEIFDRFPQLNGLVTRFGETYLHDTPFHSGGSPISTKEAQADHRLFINSRDHRSVARYN